jgi:hypothetical protein
MADKPVTKWFIEPLNAQTNEVISKSQQFLSEEKMLNGVTCEDEEKHQLWEVNDYAFVTKLCCCRRQFGLSFNVWNQTGTGKIRLWTFHLRKKKKTKSAK